MREIQDMTVLVVDDEPDLGELIAFEFELVGANVLNASNGKEAYEIVKKSDIDVIVSDIRMPGGDGVELLERIRLDHPAKPALIFMTGFADIRLEDAYDMGAIAMFGKPFNRKDLISTVARSTQTYNERWGIEPSSEVPTFKVSHTFTSFKEAQAAKRFNIGRGGFFLAMDDKLPNPSDPVLFELTFDKEVIPHITGEGVVRWTRRQADGDLLRGVGIEIRNLVADRRREVCDFFAIKKSIAFIPKT